MKISKFKRGVLRLSAIIFIPLISFPLVKYSLEYLGDFLTSAAFVSAAVALPEGGMDLLDAKLSTEIDLSAQSNASSNSRPDGSAQSSLTSSTLGSSSSSADSSSKQSTSAAQSSASATSGTSENTGKIISEQFKGSNSTKNITYKGASFANSTKVKNDTILAELKKKPDFKLNTKKPQVLIVHTHATEGYESKDLGYYTKGYNARTTNNAKNTVRVGEEIVKQLKAAGIGVIHDKTLHDYPSYNGAYSRSAATIKNYLKKYPSIVVVLDIHRDAIERTGGVRVKPTAVINGKKAAQVMIIAGVDDGTMDFPNWKYNMRFASLLQTNMETSYPGLTRPAMVSYRRYNMYLTKCSLLVEVGGHANTLDEAIYSGELIGKSLAKGLKTLK